MLANTTKKIFDIKNQLKKLHARGKTCFLHQAKKKYVTQKLEMVAQNEKQQL